jgi:HlyD family secretion protein
LVVLVLAAGAGVGFWPTAEFTPQTVETPDLRTKLVYQVRVYACNADDELRLGMPATVTIRLDGSPPADGKAPDCLAAASTASAD